MASAFRTVFHFQEHVNWFPGHMLKSMRELSERLSQCHAVLEVRDARLPFSSANPSLHSIIQGKKRVIYFNKADLIEPAQAKMIKSRIEKSSAATTRCLFGSTLETNCASSILRELNAAVSTNESAPSIDKSVVDNDRVTYSAKPSVFLPNKSAQSQNVVAIIGMPNVGKSSVINALRRHAGGRGKAVRVGATPGLTRNISGIKVQDNPPMMVLDTPGVLVPATRLQPLAGLKLALASCIKETVVDQVLLIDLLLFSLNQPGAGAARYSYVKAFEFDGPTDDIEVFMEHVGRRYGFLGAGGVVNDAQVSSHVLSAYRAGKLGKLLLDQ